MSAARARGEAAPARFHAALREAPSEQDPVALLAFARSRFGERVALATSLGPQTLVLLDMQHRAGLTTPVFCLDTELLFEETYELIERVEARYGLIIERLRPDFHVAAHDLHRRDPDRCCRERKVAPLARRLRSLDAWITGLRRDQGPTRSRHRALEWDAQFGLVKINPLITWTREETLSYLRRHRVPYNRLLDDGYASVGCWPCTRPVSSSDHERSGRWPGQVKTECGIHFDAPVEATEDDSSSVRGRGR